MRLILTSGTTRPGLACALAEYRSFARRHPHDPLTPDLLDVARQVRAELRERRRIQSITGIVDPLTRGVR